MKIKLLIFCVLIVFVEVVINQFFPSLTFINTSLVIVNRIIAYLAFFIILFCLVHPVMNKRKSQVLFGFIFFILFMIIVATEIKPVDTTTVPKEILTFSNLPDGRKIIVRSYVNAKTTSQMNDTVTVKGFFIFRKIYKH